MFVREAFHAGMIDEMSPMRHRDHREAWPPPAARWSSVFNSREKCGGLTDDTGEKHGQTIPENTTDEGQECRFTQDDSEDLTLRKAECFQHTDFTDPFAHGHGHGVRRNQNDGECDRSADAQAGTSSRFPSSK